MFNYGIGGNERKIDQSSEGIADIPQNRTLFATQLTGDPAPRPEMVYDLKTTEEVFAHYQPESEVEFITSDGSFINENLRFKNLGDFGKKGIIAQSAFLQDLDARNEAYQQVVRHLKVNKILKAALEKPEAKAALLGVFQTLINELEEAG
ncbi:hypothetical protein SAMN04487996_106211 [Dyadobacter soli]|uniref:Type VI secretion system, VipA, VC_A0107 or Hcp2 n=1 Tax=Dyadobacter soli TaxID=659014 RepID=A0A1G7EYP0_9BACT|nr:hypothetical protein [Dyadobacter soli]SDE68758.1 hypothetical protein SAMN04487996_106211 [Dyadobacter soli]